MKNIYRKILIERKTGKEIITNHTLEIEDNQVINKQVELSSFDIVVLFRKIKTEKELI